MKCHLHFPSYYISLYPSKKFISNFYFRKMEPENKKEEVSTVEDLITLAGTNGWKNYLLFVACSYCKAQN